MKTFIQKSVDSFRDHVYDLFSIRKSNVIIDMLDFEVAGDIDAQFSKADSRTWLTYYQSMMWIFKGVHTVASSAAMIPGKIWENDTEVKDHPLLDLLINPNSLNTKYELFFKTFAFLELVGNCYWFLQRDEITNKVIKIHVARPDRVRAIGPNESKNKKEITDEQRSFVRIRANGELETWSMDNVVHFSFFNPLSDFQGYGPVAALKDTGILDLFLLEYGSSFYKNAARPSLVFTTKNRVSGDSIERFMATMRRMHKGVKNMHKIMLLEEDIVPTELKMKHPNDSDLVRSQEHSQEKILTSIGTYHLVALLQNAQGNIIRDALRMFYENTVDPKLVNVEQTITKELLWQMDMKENASNSPNLKLKYEFDRRGVSGFRESAMDESIADFRNIQSGKVTINELRRMRGLTGDLPWGDMPPPAILASLLPEDLNGLEEEAIGGSRGRFFPNEERSFVDDVTRGKQIKAETYSSMLGFLAELVAEKLQTKMLENK